MHRRYAAVHGHVSLSQNGGTYPERPGTNDYDSSVADDISLGQRYIVGLTGLFTWLSLKKGTTPGAKEIIFDVMFFSCGVLVSKVKCEENEIVMYRIFAV